MGRPRTIKLEQGAKRVTFLTMMPNSKKLATSPILWSLVWAAGILAAAFLFKRNPANYWIESALVVGALTTVVLKAQRPVCSAR
jgi:hypothetical protein